MGSHCSCFAGMRAPMALPPDHQEAAKPTAPPPGLSLMNFPADFIQGRLLPALQGKDLALTACTTRDLSEMVSSNSHLWKTLALDYLGTAVCALHEAIAPLQLGHGEAHVRRWWQALLKAACGCETLRWERTASQRLLCSDASKSLLRCCAHTSVSIGPVVLLIGGQRMGSHPASGVVVVNCRLLQVWEAELTPDSEKPEPRIRHASCEIAPVEGSDLPRVVVVGGVTEQRYTSKVMHGSREVLVLELMDPYAFRVRWRRQPCQGDAPSGEAPLFHHVLCPADAGQSVLAWGGDTMDFDSQNLEIARQDCESRAASVFKLDVQKWHWTRVQTLGNSPGHRSLAAAVVHEKRMIVIGGSSDPKPPRAFNFGDLAPMTPWALDLRTWTWHQGPEAEDAFEEPEPRTRFAVERRGDWLFGQGGRDDQQNYLDDLFCLNLKTLKYKEIIAEGEENVDHPDALGSCMCGGLVLGGLTQGFSIAKADALVYSSIQEFSSHPAEQDQVPQPALTNTDEAAGQPQRAVRQFAVGQRIRLQGLVARPELNGLIGDLNDFLEDRGRWSIRLIGGRADMPILLRPENLQEM